MASSDFPTAVSPRMADGGSPPMGALSQASAPVDLVTMFTQEIQSAAANVERLISHLRQIPGLDKDTFEQGVSSMKRGLSMIAGSLPAGR